MPFSYEERVKIVKLVKEQCYSYAQAGKTVGVSKTVVMGWVKRVEKHGYESLKSYMERKQYTGDFKLTVVEYMHAHHLSRYSVAAHFNLSSTQVQRWERIYYEEGAQALLQERRGKTRNVEKYRLQKSELTETRDLIEENHHLKMENEYLKKLNALILLQGK